MAEAWFIGRWRYDISAVNDFHNKAMDLTDIALLARLRGDSEVALPLFEQALEYN